MAGAVVGIVIDKLTNIIENEIKHLGSVGNKVKRVKRELIRIQCCLRDADSKRKDARVQNWLNELRDVAYRIEDVTYTFFLEVEDHPIQPQEDPMCCPKLKYLFKKPLEMPILHNLGNELNEILNVLIEISNSRVNYGIQNLQDIVEVEVQMPLRRAAYFDVDDNQVVGLETHKNNILKLLRPEETLRRAVITIVGPGGLGKTTLARMVYTSAKSDFDYHIMLSISKQFSLVDLLRKMLCQLKDSALNNLDVGDLVNELKSSLSSIRYLIILDDVWEVNLWNQLQYAFPDVENGSRVLMTSRLLDVANSPDSKMAPYALNFLDDRESLDLLLKKVFPYKEPEKECPKDILELAPILSKKCKGLPIALIVLGGILATKELSYPAWERVLQTMNWPSDGSSCMQILAMSYEDMPYYLKACFQYLASFPEDYMISAKRLIRMWVAEGFIPQKGRPTIEIMAENCLEELFTRSMIQVSSRCMNGLIKCFHVHDLLRDLAKDEAEQENFVTVFSQASDDNEPNKIIRRASFQGLGSGSQFEEYVDSNTDTHSLLLIRVKLLTMSFECSNFRLLKVLELAPVGQNCPPYYIFQSLEGLIHLKYLGFRGFNCRNQSFSFHRMRRLETLDVGVNVKLNALWAIYTLRHVLSGRRNNNILVGPESTAVLRNIQTMRWITPPATWAVRLPLLNNLRKLGVCEIEDWITVTNLLKTLPSLVSLGIRAKRGESLPVEIIYPKSLPNYHKLQSLLLEGRWPVTVTLEASLFPAHLVKLTLENSEIKQNPMPELGKLNSLKKLCLSSRAFSDSYSGPTICPAGFPVLQYLIANIKDLTVASGVMPKLTYLQVDKKVQLHLPPELHHITTV